eukprot:764671-Hanusia_phi.AAC.2
MRKLASLLNRAHKTQQIRGSSANLISLSLPSSPPSPPPASSILLSSISTSPWPFSLLLNNLILFLLPLSLSNLLTPSSPLLLPLSPDLLLPGSSEELPTYSPAFVFLSLVFTSLSAQVEQYEEVVHSVNDAEVTPCLPHSLLARHNRHQNPLPLPPRSSFSPPPPTPSSCMPATFRSSLLLLGKAQSLGGQDTFVRGRLVPGDLTPAAASLLILARLRKASRS